MGEGLLDKKIEVYSEKYDIHGEILDYGFVIILKFFYEENEVEMAIDRPFPDSSEAAFKKVGEEMINVYIEKLLSGEIKIARTMLRYWHIDKRESAESQEEYLLAHGRVTGHRKLTDSMYIHTSVVKEVIINKDTEEAEIHTMNSVYYCPLQYCDFEKQDEWPEIIPNYEEIKQKYIDSIENPSIEAGKILLVLSNFDEYYFNSLCYIPEGETEKIQYYADAHIGMFQDSFLIRDESWKEIDLRYFPHYQNIEFYAEHTSEKPLFIENIGDVTLFAKTSRGTIKLEPGDRKEVCRENAEADIGGLPGGDLYPAAIIE